MLCFKNNTVNDYNVSIPEDKVLKLNNILKIKKKRKRIFNHKINFRSSVRKFISRFLTCKRNSLEINLSFELFFVDERKKRYLENRNK